MKFKEFLNPKSMLTPAIAGSFIMIIANTLWVQFALIPKWSALILSFLFLIPILKGYRASIFEKMIYFIFNGLIVFSLAINTNFAGRVLTEIASESKITALKTDSYLLLIQNAHAQDDVTPKITTTTNTVIKKKSDENIDLKENKNKNSVPSSGKRKFFGSWIKE